MGHEQAALKCFICKGDIPENSPFSEVALLDLPNGEKGYVHRRHAGVIKAADPNDPYYSRIVKSKEECGQIQCSENGSCSNQDDGKTFEWCYPKDRP